MKHIIEEYEEEFSSTCAEVTVLSGKLKLSPGGQDTDHLVQSLDQRLRDAEETLEQIEIETPNLEPQHKEKVRGRLTSYKKELVRLKSFYGTCRREAEERKARIELFSHGGAEYADTKETDMLLENSELLDSSSRQLEAGRRLLKETEDIGADVLMDLGTQRETLERSRGRLRDVESGLGESNAVLSRMLFTARQNKLALYIVGVVILVAVLVGLYYVIT